MSGEKKVPLTARVLLQQSGRTLKRSDYHLGKPGTPAREAMGGGVASKNAVVYTYADLTDPASPRDRIEALELVEGGVMATWAQAAARMA